MNIILIQARTFSKRFPRKVLHLLNNGNTILEECYLRCKKARVDKVIVAIPENDIELIEYCKQEKIDFAVGSENDVLQRFFYIAKEIRPKNIIRITADCPLIDYKIINAMLETHIEKLADYTANNIFAQETFPDGLDVEILTFETLKELNFMSIGKHREHVTSMLKEDYFKGHYHINNYKNIYGDFSNMRLTVDYQDDLKNINMLISNLPEYFGLKEIIRYSRENKLNLEHKRNEGYYNEL